MEGQGWNGFVMEFWEFKDVDGREDWLLQFVSATWWWLVLVAMTGWQSEEGIHASKLPGHAHLCDDECLIDGLHELKGWFCQEFAVDIHFQLL